MKTMKTRPAEGAAKTSREAGSEIIKATAKILEDFAKDARAERLWNEQPSSLLIRIDQLTLDANMMAADGFSNLEEAAVWLREVSRILPVLWD